MCNHLPLDENVSDCSGKHHRRRRRSRRLYVVASLYLYDVLPLSLSLSPLSPRHSVNLGVNASLPTLFHLYFKIINFLILFRFVWCTMYTMVNGTWVFPHVLEYP